MHEPKRLMNAFEWGPPGIEDPTSPVPMPPRRHPETRKPVYRLELTGHMPSELFFVNDSEETLVEVSTGSAGFQTCNDDVVSFANEDGYRYKDVRSEEAVKVAQFDDYLDLDYMMQVEIVVEAASGQKRRFRPPTEKGSISSQVLLWDSGDPGKYVTVQDVDEESPHGSDETRGA